MAEIFTGKNPLKPTNNLLSPIELDKVGYIVNKNGGTIKRTINEMLAIDYKKRIRIELALDRFTGII